MSTDDKHIVQIVKEPDDPLAFRISIGGRPDTGYYAVYRGNLESCKMVMRVVMQALEKLNGSSEPETKLMPLPTPPPSNESATAE